MVKVEMVEGMVKVGGGAKMMLMTMTTAQHQLAGTIHPLDGPGDDRF
jgi:hypothetical protein